MFKRRPYLALMITGLAMVVMSALLLAAPPVYAQDEAEAWGEPPTFLTGYYEQWVGSPHARFEDDAFRHWDEDGEISQRCATCHSTSGYEDFLGADGTEAGVVDAPAPLGSVVNCDACHNPAAANMTTVTFPSGAVVENLSDSTRCMVCHQGRQSGVSVSNDIEEVGLTGEPNTVSEDLGFLNIHYYAAASSLYGSEVTAGFEFDGLYYQMRNEHVEGFETCADCHQPHTLELRVNECATCHEGADNLEAIQEIRMVSSLVDYDGDGDIEEGIKGEIETLQAILYEAIQVYAADVVGTPIIYSSSHPYFFADTDGDGEESEDETVRANSYSSFTPLLLQTTYNYQVTKKDPGGYTHNADYHIQLLVDSIDAINEQLETPVNAESITRDNFGHFNSSAEAFRHWDEDGEVSARCSKCHTAEGLPFYLEHGVNIAFEPSSAQECMTCHDNLEEYTLYAVEEVEFPSGATLAFDEDSPNNICLECHQGRESSVSIANAISNAGVGDDEVSDALNFRNPHYFASGATLFGTEAKGAYEYEGMEYNGLFEHTRQFNECSDCHEQHAAFIRFEECIECHTEVETAEDLSLIRFAVDEDGEETTDLDYDGDGDVEEGIAAEIETLHGALFDEIIAYTGETLEGTILYAPNNYPYWYTDTNENGEIDDGELSRDNRWGQWTPTLLRATYNYKYVAADPGSFSHNSDYILQVLYDSLQEIGGDEAVASFIRPPLRELD